MTVCHWNGRAFDVTRSSVEARAKAEWWMAELEAARPAVAFMSETMGDVRAFRGLRKLLKRKGYHAATVQDIADAVGILKGSLYHHFKSKDDLLYFIVKEPIFRMYSRMGEIAASDLPASEKLRRAILAHLDGFDQHYPTCSSISASGRR